MKYHDSYDSDESDLTWENEISIKPPVKNEHCVTYRSFRNVFDDDIWREFGWEE